MTLQLCTVPPQNKKQREVRNAKQYWRYYSLLDYNGNWVLSILPNYDPVIVRHWIPVYVDTDMSRADAAAMIRAARREKKLEKTGKCSS